MGLKKLEILPEEEEVEEEEEEEVVVVEEAPLKMIHSLYHVLVAVVAVLLDHTRLVMPLIPNFDHLPFALTS